MCTVLGLLMAASVGPRVYADDPARADASSAGLAARIQDLNLTDEQETKIADIRKECRPKIEEATKELAGIVKDEVEKVRGVLTPEQREKLQALKDERKEHRFEGLAERMAHLKSLDLTDAEMSQIGDIRTEYRPKIEEALTRMRGILTDEQKKAREEGLKAGKSRREVRESLNLTDDQKAKFEAVCKDVCGLVKEEMGKIKDCLSDEQQAKLAELKDERKDRVRDRWACRIANMQELNLTDEQKNAIAEIRKEYRPKVQEAGNKLRAAVRDQMSMILDTIKG